MREPDGSESGWPALVFLLMLLVTWAYAVGII